MTTLTVSRAIPVIGEDALTLPGVVVRMEAGCLSPHACPIETAR